MNIESPTSNIELVKMKKHTYDLEERLLEYSVRIIKKKTEIVIKSLTSDFLIKMELNCEAGRLRHSGRRLQRLKATSLYDVQR